MDRMFIIAKLIFWALIFLIVFLTMLLTAGPAKAWAPLESFDNRDKVFFTLLAVDWLQTRDIAANPDRFYECNPILGEHPSLGEVDRYFITSVAINYTIHRLALTSERWARFEDYWQTAGLALELYCVGNNYTCGINLRF
jgi:hypothetical protein